MPAVRRTGMGEAVTEQPTPKPRGFARLSPEQRREMAKLGGRSIPAEHRSFSRNPELAKAAGAKGGGKVPAAKRTFSTNRDLARRAGGLGGRNKRTRATALPDDPS